MLKSYPSRKPSLQEEENITAEDASDQSQTFIIYGRAVRRIKT